VGELLRRRIKQETPFRDSGSEAFLSLLVAADVLRSRFDRICAEFGITHGQYNVLRILRGAHPTGHPRCEIAARLLERAPDVTRLVDRLAAQGLVERSKSREDRRVSLTRITEKGLALLDEMEPSVAAFNEDFGARVSARDRRELDRICEGIFADE
jgi:DNA-binding MarR family transcriptional regulator